MYGHAIGLTAARKCYFNNNNNNKNNNKTTFVRHSNMARVTTRAPYNVRCSYSGNSGILIQYQL